VCVWGGGGVQWEAVAAGGCLHSFRVWLVGSAACGLGAGEDGAVEDVGLRRRIEGSG
jgi:hypothetical protein